MKKLSLLAFVMLAVFACTKVVDEEPIDLNQKGFCIGDPFGNGCEQGDDDGGGSGGGSGGTNNNSAPPPLGSHFITFAKGLSSSNINTAKATNSAIAWQDYGATPGAWNTTQGPAAVVFGDEIFMFHASQASSKVIQSHAQFDTNGGLSWQTTNSNIELGNGVQTNQALTATVWQNRIFIANKHLSNDAIYVSRSHINDGTNYEDEELAVTDFENDGGTASNTTINGWPPYLTVYQDKLYLFWVKRANNRVYYKVKETLNGPWGQSTEVTGTLSGQTKKADHGVSATEHAGKLYIAYPLQNSGMIMTRQVLPLAPDIQNVTEITNAFAKNRPSMTSDGTRMMMVYRDMSDWSQNDVYFTFTNSNGSWVGDLKGRGETLTPPYVVHVNGN